jgi:hypothetical protein
MSQKKPSTPAARGGHGSPLSAVTVGGKASSGSTAKGEQQPELPPAPYYCPSVEKYVAHHTQLMTPDETEQLAVLLDCAVAEVTVREQGAREGLLRRLAAAIPARIISLVFAAPKAPAGETKKTVPYPTTTAALMACRPRLQMRKATPANIKMAATLPKVPQLTLLLRWMCFALTGAPRSPAVDVLLPLSEWAHLLTKVLMFQLFPRPEGVKFPPSDGLKDGERRALQDLREVAAFTLAALARCSTSDRLYTVIDTLFPAEIRANSSLDDDQKHAWGREATQPLFAPLLHDEWHVRFATWDALATVLNSLADKFTIAAEVAKTEMKFGKLRTIASSFTSLSERLANILEMAHDLLVRLALDTSETDPRWRARSLNSAATVAQFTPYSRCPKSADHFFGRLLVASTFRDAAMSEGPRHMERTAAFFCLTAAHRNKHAFAHLRSFYAAAAAATPAGSPTKPAGNDTDAGAVLLAIVAKRLPHLDAFRALSSLAKEHPHALRAHWPRVSECIVKAVAKLPSSGGPHDPTDDGESRLRVETIPLEQVLGSEYQVPTEALRTLLYFMGPFGTAKYTEEQWVAELSGGTFLHASAINHGGTVAADASALAVDARKLLVKSVHTLAKEGLRVAKFSMPLSAAEAVGRGPSAGQRATAAERVGIAATVLRARYARVEGVRRLGFRLLAHFGDAALQILPPNERATLVSCVLEDGLREQMPAQVIDVLLTIQKWASQYQFFATTPYVAMFVNRLRYFIDHHAASLAVTTTAASTAVTLAQRLHQLAAVPNAAAEIPKICLSLASKMCEVAESFRVHAQVVGNCLKCMALCASAVDADYLIAPMERNEEGLANEVLTRTMRAIVTPTSDSTTNPRDRDEAERTRKAEEQQLARALAGLAAKECLQSPAIRMADPQAASGLARAICDDLLIRNSYVERTAALKVLATVPAAVFVESCAAPPELIRRVCESVAGIEKTMQPSTLKQLRQLEMYASAAVQRLFEAAKHGCTPSDKLDEVVAEHASTLYRLGVVPSVPSAIRE